VPCRRDADAPASYDQDVVFCHRFVLFVRGQKTRATWKE
jgi:hypothetical protein